MTETVSTRYASFRDGFAAIRELLIVLAMLSLLFSPQAVRRLLDEAGIRSLAGIEFDAETLSNVAEADIHLRDIENELAMTNYALTRLSENEEIASTPEFIEACEHVGIAQTKSIEVESKLQEVIEEQQLRRHETGAPNVSELLAQQPDLLPPDVLFQR